MSGILQALGAAATRAWTFPVVNGPCRLDRRVISGMAASAAVTEIPNELMRDIDISEPVGIVRLLRQADAQIFAGWGGLEGLYDSPTVSTIEKLADGACDILRNPTHSSIVLSGCGTSGRLAFISARSFNALLAARGIPPCYHYIIAGGDKALLKSVEATEDSWKAGVEALTKVTEGKQRVLFIGITCGLSAPFVAGQLDYCLQHKDVFTPVLLGFNPTYLARNYHHSLTSAFSYVSAIKGSFAIAACCRNEYTAKPVGSNYSVIPFVAGQLDYCLQHKDVFTPVLLGFNPTYLARKTAIIDWDKTFYDVAMRLEEESKKRGNSFILNPVVGPEAITGSTRMKSGTVTKILLEIISTLACQRLSSTGEKSSVTDLLQSYELTYRHTYLHSVAIATSLQAAGQCLCAGGRVYYLGVSSLGIMAIIDASECPPTFGAAYGDVRGFVRGGYRTLRNSKGDLSTVGSDYKLSWEDFTLHFLPAVSSQDFVVFVVRASEYVHVASEVQELCTRLRDTGCRTCCIVIGTSCDSHTIDWSLFDSYVEVLLPWEPLSHYWSCDNHMDQSAFLCEAAVKWVLNAISTGAHILKGKILGNRMIDLQISNSKLYHRAIGIIQDFSHVSEREAKECLLSAIFGTDTPDDSLMDSDISDCVQTATGQQKILPVALLLSTGQFSVKRALEALQSQPVVRSILTRQRN